MRFKFKDSITEKGEKARWHTNLIAQEIEEAFKRHSLDARELGVLCFDEWDEEWIEHPDTFRETDILGSDGKFLVVLDVPAWKEKVRDKGGIYGVRGDEAQALEAALIRRTLKRLGESK